MEQTFDASSEHPMPWHYAEHTDGFVRPAILVVEDDRDIREMLSTLLDIAGYSVRTCATAEEALHALREESFDLVLTDYALPQRNGLWLIEHASAEGLTADTPVLLVTAHPHVAEAVTCEVIPKPFDIDDLVERVRRRTEPSRPRARRLAAGPRQCSKPAAEGPQSPEPVELVLYVNSRSPKSAVAVRSLRKAVARINSPRAKITICEMEEDPCTAARSQEQALDRTTRGPRTFILGHITNPEALLELLSDCDMWD